MDIMDTFYSEIAGSGRDFRKAREKRQNQEQFVKGAVAGFNRYGSLYCGKRPARRDTQDRRDNRVPKPRQLFPDMTQ